MMSGARRTTSSGSAMMRFLPSGSRASSGKQSSPPAMPISSDTQRMPEICGSSHSSKYTRGRRGNRAAARARIASSPRSSCVDQRRGLRLAAHHAAERRDHRAGSPRRCDG